jgi:hypothetical protein
MATIPNREPLDWQEAHSPTEPVEIVTHYNAQGRQVREQGRMRKTEARLWAILDTEQREAVQRIAKGAEYISGRMHRFRPQWVRIAAGHGEPNDPRGLERAYLQWVRECEAEKVSTIPTLAVWRDGDTLTAVARRLRVHRIRARWHMTESLDIYCRMIGIKKGLTPDAKQRKSC